MTFWIKQNLIHDGFSKIVLSLLTSSNTYILMLFYSLKKFFSSNVSRYRILTTFFHHSKRFSWRDFNSCLPVQRMGCPDWFTFTCPVNTRRYLDVDSTSFERYGRQMDVKTMLCAFYPLLNNPFYILFHLTSTLCCLCWMSKFL